MKFLMKQYTANNVLSLRSSSGLSLGRTGSSQGWVGEMANDWVWFVAVPMTTRRSAAVVISQNIP